MGDKNPENTHSHEVKDPAPAHAGIVDWATDHVWAPVRDYAVKPAAEGVGLVGIQAGNAAINVLNLAPEALNCTGVKVPEIPKIPELNLGPATGEQRFVRDLSAGVSYAFLLSKIAKGTSKALSSTVPKVAQFAGMSESNALKLSASLGRPGTGLVLGGSAYEFARDPNQGETRIGNMAGGAAAFLTYANLNQRLMSPYAETGLLNKLGKAYLPRVGVGVVAGTLADGISTSISTSLLHKTPTLAFSSALGDNLTTNAALNLVLPTFMGGKGAPISEIAESKSGSSPRAEILQMPDPKLTAMKPLPETTPLTGPRPLAKVIEIRAPLSQGQPEQSRTQQGQSIQEQDQARAYEKPLPVQPVDGGDKILHMNDFLRAQGKPAALIGDHDLARFDAERQAEIQKGLETLRENGYNLRHVRLMDDGNWYFDTSAESDAAWAQAMREDKP